MEEEFPNKMTENDKIPKRKPTKAVSKRSTSKVSNKTGVWRELSKMLILEGRITRLWKKKKRKNRFKPLMIWMLDYTPRRSL